MTNTQDLQNLIGTTAVDSSGDKIGKVGQIYLDDSTGQPQWVTVSTGLFGNHESFAPLAGSSHDGGNLKLSVTKEQIKGAPQVDDDGHLDDAENDRLYEYYSGQYSGTNQYAGDYRTDNVGTDNVNTHGTQGHDTSGPTTDDAMTLSEERLKVGKTSGEVGRARLRKYVVTENVSTTVPLSHEEVRLEREPITDANIGNAMSGKPISEEEHEVVLHAEQAVVQTEAVPVERVRLATETVTENQEVTGQVRKERVDAPEVVTETNRTNNDRR